jgi:hypothetical protein
MVGIFMAAKIDNTPTATQKGAPLPATRNTTDLGPEASFSRHACREKSPASPAGSTKLLKLLDTLSGGSQQCYVAVTSHAAVVGCHPRENVPLVDTRIEIEKGFSPSESATSQKLSRYTFDMVRERKKWALVALRVRQLNVTYHPGSHSEAVSRVTSHESRVTNYLDTRVEIKIESTLAESATSPKTSRYTFDMLGNGKKGG